MRRLPLVTGAVPWLAVLGLVSLLFLLWSPYLSLLPLALVAFILFFFRDPERRPPVLPDILVSPADGRVIEIGEVFEDRFLNDMTQGVSIFLSLFDVHVVRSPVAGKVEYLRYEKGRFLPAFHRLALHENERNLIGISNDRTRVLMTQVAGVIARRVICYLKEGDTVAQGQRIGLIRFGSRVDILMPKSSVEITVEKGQRVKAGETIVGRLKFE